MTTETAVSPRSTGQHPGEAGSDTSSPRAGLTLEVTGMSCASCVGRVERSLKKLDGVSDALVNLATETAEVTTDGPVTAESLVAAVRAAGYGASVATPSRDPAAEAEGRRARRAAELARRRALLAAGILGSTVVLVGAYGFAHSSWSPWLQLALAVPVWAIVGWVFHQGALRAAAHGSVNMDTLVSLGSSVALVYSIVALAALPGRPTYFDVAALIVTLIAVGKYLELVSRGRAGEAIEELAGLQPDVAHLLARGGAPGYDPTGPISAQRASDVSVASLRIDDVVLVRPGERIPTDSILASGDGRVDESMLTGESVPDSKHPGDELTGGTVNGLSPLVARVRRVGADTTLARILHLVEEAQTDKSKAQRLADRVSSVFVPAILGLAAATFLGWIATGHSLVGALVPSVAVLVVACPCALGLATPVAIMVSSGRGAQLGLLVRGGEALERIHDIGAVVLDKTGTLTLGRPEVTDLITLGDKVRSDRTGAGGEDLGPGAASALGAAAALEASSEHPLARAIVAAAAAGGIELPSAAEVNVTPGGGVSGVLDGTAVHVGSIAWLDSLGVDTAAAAPPAARLAKAGRTPVGVATGSSLVLLVGVADPLRPDAASGVARLRSLGLSVVLASGDAQGVADAVAAQVGIGEVHAPLRPEDKAALVASLRERHHQVAMVGDGINDAPALAAADVGIAVGNGTGVAMAAADITLVHGDVGAVADAIALSRSTRRIIWQNLGWAFGYNAVLVPLAAFGILPPIFAALAMATSSVSVVLNALRLRRFGHGQDATRALQPSN